MSKEKKTTKTETTTEDDEEVVIIDVKEEPELTVEDLPGVGPATAEKLREAGFNELLAIAVMTPRSLADAAELGEAVSAKIITSAKKLANIGGFISGNTILERRREVLKLSSGCAAIDELLGGGFETQSILISDQKNIDVILVESLESLEEVQVVAFQKQKKNSVIGSINTINPSELKIPTSNITNAMAGKLAGMISYQRSGEPGADNAEFFIRGVTSFGYANNPLILIDGLEVTTDDLARIEPDNIASFSIMKDATATSLYGARGANGVILVTTKEGKKGKAKVSFRYENSVSAPSQTNEF